MTPTLRYEAGVLFLLDQTRLPTAIEVLECRDVEAVFEAIRRLSVRGAPAIGCAAAYGVCVAARRAERSAANIAEAAHAACERLAQSRPTAVNLFWALDQLRTVLDSHQIADSTLVEELEAVARQIEEDDRAMCRAIGQNGAPLLPRGGGVLTHCNAGALATAGDGTALAVLFAAHEAGRNIHVFADETRPLLQGARLTVWECQQRGVPVTLLCDNAAGWAMQCGKVAAVVTGADRIAANGDVANKIGTYGVAALAAAHDIPFYVAAPSSTFDLSLANGAAIPIEERAASEVTHGFGRQTAPDETAVWNPAFDVTPAHLIAGLITERGVVPQPSTETIAEHLGTAAVAP